MSGVVDYLNQLIDGAAKATSGPLYAVVDDLIGGYIVANRDASMSAIDTRPGTTDRVVAEFVCREDAEHIAAADPQVVAALAHIALAADRFADLHPELKAAFAELSRAADQQSRT